jgi:hypothetical protein
MPQKLNAKKPILGPAILNVDKGDEIVGGWITPKIPEVGAYKLLVVKRKSGKFDWAHFIQRDNGNKDRVMRGTLNNIEELESLKEMINKNLGKVYGAHIKLFPADYDMMTLDGKKSPPLIQ